MAKDKDITKAIISSSSSSYYKTLILIPILLLLLSLLILLLYHVSQNEILHESDSPQQPQPEEESPYHDTLKVNLDISELNPRIVAAESIWGRFASSRKQNMEETAAYANDSIPLIKILEHFPPNFDCPLALEPIGNDIGNSGWVCGLELFQDEDECAFYSIGITNPGKEFPAMQTFESELLRRTRNCHLFIYNWQGAELTESSYQERVEFRHIGSTSDIPVLNHALKVNGHGWIDILKIDLGDHGISILDQAIQEYEEVLPFGQLQLRLTLYEDHPFGNYTMFFQKLEDKGLRPFHAHVEQIECNNVTSVGALTVEYSFINLRGKHVLLKPAT